jgi:hypothetical protein
MDLEKLIKHYEWEKNPGCLRQKDACTDTSCSSCNGKACVTWTTRRNCYQELATIESTKKHYKIKHNCVCCAICRNFTTCKDHCSNVLKDSIYVKGESYD